MLDTILNILTNKQIFTNIILTLYVTNFLFQFLYTKDYWWGGYWLCAAGITLCAMQLSSRG